MADLVGVGVGHVGDGDREKGLRLRESPSYSPEDKS